MFSWYSAAGYGRSGSYGSWYGRRRDSWGGKSEVRSEDEWFCQKCSAGNWWSRTECGHCASVTNDTADAPQTSMLGEDCSPGEDDSWYGQRRAYCCWRVLERELEWHQQKLNGPKNTAKHIEAKQNWINRESKRIETESAKLAEMQESIEQFTRRSRYSEKT